MLVLEALADELTEPVAELAASASQPWWRR
jgi:hypothetical protein